MTYYFKGQKVGNVFDLSTFLQENHPEVLDKICDDNELEYIVKRHGAYIYDYEQVEEWFIDNYERMPGYEDYGIVYYGENDEDVWTLRYSTRGREVSEIGD